MSQGDSGDCGAAGGWLTGWIQSAKEKSVTALNLVKRDLAEFTSTMHDDTVKAASSIREKLTQENATAATQKVKQGVTTLLGGISKALVVEPDDDYQLARIVGGEAVIFDRFKARVHAVQIDPTTYTANPTPEDRYNEWLATFDLEGSKGAISELLVSNTDVRALYTQLVPLTVSNNDFWRRYFFRVHLLEEEEARRVELMRRAENVQDDNEKEIGWEDEDDDDNTTTETCAAVKSQSSTNDDKSTVCSSSAQQQYVAETSDAATGEFTATDSQPLQHSESSSPMTESSVTVSSGSVADTAGETVELGATGIAASFLSIEPADSAKSTDRESVVSSHSSEPSGWSAVSSSDVAKSDSLVVVAATPDRTTPSDEGSSNAKESLDEDWEKDFDVEVTEQELEAAKERLKSTATTQPAKSGDKPAEDWEDW